MENLEAVSYEIPIKPRFVRASVRSGFTLVETIFAIVIFSMMSLGLTSSLIQSLKMSDRVVCKSTAHNIALGYAEQIMAYSYDELKEALLLSEPFTLYSTSLGGSNVVAVEDLFTFGVENEKLIIMDINRDTQAATKTMPMRFTMDAVNLNTGSDPMRALQITINYSYLNTSADADKESSWQHGVVHVVKSLVDIY
jgi:prepilin-type N-terminal cleavage/methylation domain-containing protein